MKKALALVAVLSVAVVAFAATLKVEDVLRDANKNDGKVVTVGGKVKEFRVRTSRAGRDYTTFKLVGTNKELNVYLQGKPKETIKNDDKVEVTGVYRKEKKVNENFTVKNEVDASNTGRGNEKNGVKVVR